MTKCTWSVVGLVALAALNLHCGPAGVLNGDEGSCSEHDHEHCHDPGEAAPDGGHGAHHADAGHDPGGGHDTDAGHDHGGGEYIVSPTLDGLEAAPTTDFDAVGSLRPSWGSGDIPASAAPDVVGAFRFICGAGQLSYDDPIVYPGQPGKAHLHQFYGHLGANAHSTYESLRATSDSTCNSDGLMDGAGRAANRSAYWMPAMLDGVGNVVRPDHVSIYYKRLPKSDPRCNHPSRTDLKAQGICVGIPNGLRMIAGSNLKDQTGGHFKCDGGTAASGNYDTLEEALPHCAGAQRIGAVISFPPCWDGKHLDSPDHRSHLASPSYGSWGYLRCPETHPYLIPTFTLGAWYTNDANFGTWKLSSDEADPSKPRGWTFHADYFEAWDEGVKQMWQDHCVDKLLNCSGGDLGNGLQLPGASQPYYNGVKSWTHPERLVPIPPRPN